MALKIQDSIVVDAPRADVWNLLFDADVMKQIMNKVPGVHVERLVRASEDRYEGTATIGVAMVKGKYDATLTVVEKRPSEFARIRGEGKGGGNFMNGEIAVTLSDHEGKTLLKYEGSGSVAGALASVGQRLIDTVGKQFIAAGSKALAEELAAKSREK